MYVVILFLFHRGKNHGSVQLNKLTKVTKPIPKSELKQSDPITENFTPYYPYCMGKQHQLSKPVFTPVKWK